MIRDRRSIIIGIVSLLLIAAISALFVFPQLASQRKAEKELALQNTQLQQIQARVASVKGGGRDAIQQLAERSQLADTILPSSVEQAAVFARVPPLAASSGVTLTNLAPSAAQVAPGGSGTLMYVGYDTTATGSLDAISTWLKALRAEPTLLLTVTDPAISSAGTDGSYSVHFTLRVWYTTQPVLTGASPAPGAPAPGAPAPSPSR